MLNEVLAKYQISSDSVLYRWIRKYTSHSELKDSGKGMGETMTKGRSTTAEELKPLKLVLLFPLST